MKIELIRERETFYFRVFILITLIISFILWLMNNNSVFIIIPFIQLIPLIISPSYLYKNIGMLNISENDLMVSFNNGEQQNYSINNKLQIKIFYDGQRSSKSYKNLIAKGFVVRIQFEAEDNFGEYKILVKKNERDGFIKVMETLYKKGIQIRERDDLGAKYFLLEGNLSYSKIQEIKVNYNIEW